VLGTHARMVDAEGGKKWDAALLEGLWKRKATAPVRDLANTAVIRKKGKTRLVDGKRKQRRELHVHSVRRKNSTQKLNEKRARRGSRTPSIRIQWKGRARS